MNITKPAMTTRDIDVTDRLTAIEILDASPVGTVAQLTDASQWQAINAHPGAQPPLWSQFSGPGCLKTLTASELVGRAQRLEGASR